MGLSICTSTSHHSSLTHTLTITCTCARCYDVIYGAQDGKMMCSHANSLILSQGTALSAASRRRVCRQQLLLTSVSGVLDGFRNFVYISALRDWRLDHTTAVDIAIQVSFLCEHPTVSLQLARLLCYPCCCVTPRVSSTHAVCPLLSLKSDLSYRLMKCAAGDILMYWAISGTGRLILLYQKQCILLYQLARRSLIYIMPVCR